MINFKIQSTNRTFANGFKQVFITLEYLQNGTSDVEIDFSTSGFINPSLLLPLVALKESSGFSSRLNINESLFSTGTASYLGGDSSFVQRINKLGAIVDTPNAVAFHKKSFKVIRMASDSIYLNDEDIGKLLDAKLSTAKAHLRDIFIMACFTGQRHSDWHQLRKETIIRENGKDILKIAQQKGKKIVHVPVHPIDRAILNSYGDNPPKVITNQNSIQL